MYWLGYLLFSNKKKLKYNLNCKEFVFPMCSNGVTDMFEPSEWDFKAYSAACKEQFDLTPRQEWLIYFRNYYLYSISLIQLIFQVTNILWFFCRRF